MYCANCGGIVQSDQQYCSRCGQTISPAAPAPVGASSPTATGPASPYGAIPHPGRLARHLQILGILWIVISILRLIPAGIMLMFGHGHGAFPWMRLPLGGFLAPILGAVAVFLLVTALVGFLVGWGLLDRQPWARMLAIIVGCLKLIDFPFGTALGIYTLWVLISPGAELEFQKLARRV